MMMKSLTRWLGLAVFLSASAAHAAWPFAHPAVNGAAQQSGVEQLAAANPVIVGHAASPRWKLVHANAEHPAVIVAARAPAIDPNVFIVQPPTSVQWTMGPAPESQIAAVGR
jgi:hypothetical protein